MEIGKIKIKNKYQSINDDIILFDNLFLDNFSKLSVLTILSGYGQSNNIILNDKFSAALNIKKLNSFVSYILNHRIAPMKFNIKIKLAEKKAPATKNIADYTYLKKVGAVLSFSGGLDSTAGMLYALEHKINVLPLWIDFGQRNNNAERRAAEKVCRKIGIKLLILKINLKQDIINGWKDWDFIIPGRNFLFLSLANSILKFSQQSGRKIYLCAHKDEMGFRKNKDKSQYFFDTASLFFSTDAGKKIAALSPFAKYSKSEIISYWRRNWEPKYKISPFATTTCYYNNGCGKCDACLKRAIYLLAGGYSSVGKVAVNPLTDPAKLIKNSWIPRIKAGKIARNNKLDFIIAVEKSMTIVPKYVRQFYSSLSPNTLKAVNRRKLEIEKSEIK